jgi:hypothetical protein
MLRQNEKQPIPPIKMNAVATRVITSPARLKRIAIPVPSTTSAGCGKWIVQPSSISGTSPIKAATKHDRVVPMAQYILARFFEERSRTSRVELPSLINIPSLNPALTA